MLDKNELEEIIQKLSQAFLEDRKLIGLSEIPSILHSPATEEDIATFEKRMGGNFPPSYRLFLKLHNGWEKYRNVFTLLGISGDHTEKALKDINETIAIYKAEWEKRHGKPIHENVKKFESEPITDAKTEEGAHLYIADKFHFGTDFAGSLLFFNPNVSSPDGEIEVVYRNQTGMIIGRFSNFFEMLKFDLAFLEKKIARRKAKV